jgi:beta-lactamase regulating signal transducer with metallopeptidase domain
MNTQEFLWQMGRVSLQAGVLAVLVLLVQWLARDRLSPRWRCALWGLVLVRLMVPTLPEARWSVFNWMPLPTRSTQSILSTSSISAPAVIPRAQVPSESIEMLGSPASQMVQTETPGDGSTPVDPIHFKT